MIQLRRLRFWTFLVMLGLGATIVWRGMALLRVGWAEATGDDIKLVEIATSADSLVDLAKYKVDAVEDPRRRVEQAASLLSIDPLASEIWLSLAQSRLQTQTSFESVAGALALSTLTGPNEARAMGGRAAFGLPLWAKLPPASQRALLIDLMAGWTTLDDTQRQILRATLILGPNDVREQIRAGLLLSGKSGANIAAALLTPANGG